MALQPGQMLSRYRLVEKLGQGGMGVVWKALDVELNRHVAIKILPPELTSDTERRLRFRREAQAAAALNHPSIAVIHEVGEHEGAPFLVMELLQGRTLRQVIAQGALPLKEWIEMALPIAQGIAHAHRNGIIHRDLKPDNVMITDEKQVKLLDFGLAKLFDTGKTSTPRDSELDTHLQTISQELSRTGSVYGTVSYMSPEQARAEPVDHRSDIFSFGILLYEMATGSPPFRKGSSVETLGAIIGEEPPALSEISGKMNPEAERVVRKAMEKEPGRRYQDAGDMTVDLKNLLRDLDTGRTQVPTGATGAVAPRKPGIPRGAVAAIAVMAILAVALVFMVMRRDPTDATATGVADGGASTAASRQVEAGASERTRVVVLPFRNQGSAEDEFFAEGMTEEITSRLAAISGLAVISQTSAFQYDRSGKSVREIGEDFGVDYILEGSVRWAQQTDGPSRVRISPQLIRASDDTQVWAESFDQVIDDIFQVQSQIAEKVSAQLGVSLLEPERDALVARRTDDPAAYQAYLRGLGHMRNPEESIRVFDLAGQMFERAIDLDPEFVLAHAALSWNHSAYYHWGFDRTEARQVRAKRAVDRALELDPDSPEAHLALGYYHYWCHKDYEPALAEFAIAAESLHNSAELYAGRGYVQRRQGKMEEAIVSLGKASELSPMSAEYPDQVCETFMTIRRYAEAIRACDESITVMPDQSSAYALKANTYYVWKGTTSEARAVLESAPGTDQGYQDAIYWLEIYDENYDEALEVVRSAGYDVYSYPAQLRPIDFFTGLAYRLMNDTERARVAFASARDFLEEEMAARPDDFRLYAAMGTVLAGLGEKEKAIGSALRAVDMYPVTLDALGGTNPMVQLMLTYTLVGDIDAALEQAERLLSIPSTVSIPYLRLDPIYQPLEDHPRFEELAARFE